MAKQQTQPAAQQPAPSDNGKFDLEALATQLDGLATQAATAGEEKVMKSLTNAAKSARWSAKQRGVRQKKVGNLVAAMQAKGLTPEQIIHELTK